MKYVGELLDSVFTLIQYTCQPAGVDDKASKHKSAIRNYEGDEEENVILWDEEFDLGMLYSLETMVYVRLFEYKIARTDMFVSEASISLGGLIDDLLEKMDAERLLASPGGGVGLRGNAVAGLEDVEDIRGIETLSWVETRPREGLAGTGGELLLGITFV